MILTSVVLGLWGWCGEEEGQERGDIGRQTVKCGDENAHFGIIFCMTLCICTYMYTHVIQGGGGGGGGGQASISWTMSVSCMTRYIRSSYVRVYTCTCMCTCIYTC